MQGYLFDVVLSLISSHSETGTAAGVFQRLKFCSHFSPTKNASDKKTQLSPTVFFRLIQLSATFLSVKSESIGVGMILIRGRHDKSKVGYRVN